MLVDTFGNIIFIPNAKKAIYHNYIIKKEKKQKSKTNCVRRQSGPNLIS